jgi:FKBP-type peptidyl-prolyl cis-trans isomerase FklB
MTPKMTLKWMVILSLAYLAQPAGAGEPSAPAASPPGVSVRLSPDQPAKAEAPAVLTTQQSKASYAMGVDIARNFKRMQIDFDMDLLVKGMKDELAGAKLLLYDGEIRALMVTFQSDLRRKQTLAMRTAGLENKQAGDAFLAENKTKDGVVALPSGLQYRILAKGDGKIPTEADTVEVRYRGRLIDGTEFDSSEPGGAPASFKVSGVIAGWKEALKLMPAGSKWEIFVPAHLAYGPRGAGRDIGPNCTLIFELELVSTK